jgi:hypothetical protein
VYLPAHSQFCKDVYDQIRPHIPRQQWPSQPLSAVFTSGPDGRFLAASFEGVSTRFSDAAKRAVAAGGFDLVLKSPFAYSASQLYRSLRWRNVCLFALVPLLFGIPLAAVAGANAMRVAAVLFAADLAAAAIAHAALSRRRAELAKTRISAEIPVPGLRIRASNGDGVGDLNADL